MNKKKIHRLWKSIQFSDSWLDCDTSILDDISSSWFIRRSALKEDSGEYAEFLNRLKREHAIETGVIERLYDLKKGITETFIKEGFVKSYLSHGDTDIPEHELMAHLNNHLDAVDFIFEVVKEDRPLTTGFIKELHHLVTQSQTHAEGRDQFGNKLKIDLLKGTYKVRENNPTREDGTTILYCPPEHVASEMDNLVRIYNDLVQKEVHPLIIATWFHHAFTTIHPFQDGNGRVARLLTSLIFIKYGYFPFTVLREEAKVKYIESLEKADNGNPQELINYFGEVQKRNIQKALNVKEVASTSLEEVQKIFAQKVENLRHRREIEHLQLLSNNRMEVFKYCGEVLNELKEKMEIQINGGAEITIASCSFNNEGKQHYFYQQIVGYAKKHDYFFNRALPKSWLTYRIELSENKKYQLGITIHHYGYDDSTLAIGSFLEFKSSKSDENMDTTLPLDIPPHVISIDGDISTKKKNIRSYIENAMTLTLAQIASEIK
jgi:Fic family protein